MDEQKSKTKPFCSMSIKAVAERIDRRNELKDEIKRIALWGLENHPISKRTREYVEYYYGVNGKPRLKFAEIGKILGVSQQAVLGAYWKFIENVTEDFYDFVKRGERFYKLQVYDKIVEISKKQAEELIVKIDRFNNFEKQALALYLGLLGNAPITNAQIVEKLGVQKDFDLARLKEKFGRAFIREQLREQNDVRGCDFIARYKSMDENEKADIKTAVEWYLQNYAVDEQTKKYAKDFFGINTEALGLIQITNKHDKVTATVSGVINRFAAKVEDRYVIFKQTGEVVFTKIVRGNIACITKNQISEFVMQTNRLDGDEKAAVICGLGLFNSDPMNPSKAASMLGCEPKFVSEAEDKVFALTMTWQKRHAQGKAKGEE